MSLPVLDNLIRIGQLKPEPRNELEIKRMLEMARTRLADAELNSLSREGRFTSAYNAAHTVGWPANRWRVLDTAHQKKEIWPSTKATWGLRSPPSRSCALRCRVLSLMCKH